MSPDLDLTCGPLPIVTALGVFVPSKNSQNPQTKFYIRQEPKTWLSHSVSELSSFIAVMLYQTSSTCDSEYFVHLHG